MPTLNFPGFPPVQVAGPVITAIDSDPAAYVVTFDPRPVAGPGAIAGLRRMSLDDARRLLADAARIPHHGRIIDADTLETVS